MPGSRRHPTTSRIATLATLALAAFSGCSSGSSGYFNPDAGDGSSAGGTQAGGTGGAAGAAGSAGAAGGEAGDAGSAGSSGGDGGSAGSAGSSGGAGVAGAAGGAGSSGAAGAGGSAGAAAGAAGAGGSAGAVQNHWLIDDLEDGDDAIEPVAGRSGRWYSFNDGTSTQTPAAGSPLLPSSIAPARGQSLLGIHTTGSAFTTWGAGIAFDFMNDGTPGAWGVSQPYDASNYAGIRFFARGDVAIRVELAIEETTTVAEGGACATGCNDHFGTDVTLAGAWAEHTVAFTNLTQRGFGTVATFSSTRAMWVQLLVAQGNAFDVWVDDVTFY